MKRAQRILVNGVIASLVIGATGGGVGVYLGAPFYFGFFIAFVLGGLITMFWLAAAISKELP